MTELSACVPAQPPLGTLRRAIAVRFARDVSETGAPERLRTADPQILSLGGAPVSKGQLVDHCGNEPRQGHHVISHKPPCLRVTRHTNLGTSRSPGARSRRPGGRAPIKVRCPTPP